jgi:hypothetical protein
MTRSLDILASGRRNQSDPAALILRKCVNQRSHEPVRGSSAYRCSPLTIGTMALDSFFPVAIGNVAVDDTLLTSSRLRRSS